MPWSKSSRRSKGSRTSIFSLPSMASLGLSLNAEKDNKTPEQTSEGCQDAGVYSAHDESGAKPSRTKSKLNLLTSILAPMSASSTSGTASATTDARLSQPARQQPTQPTTIKRKPVSSSFVLSSETANQTSNPSNPSPSDDSPQSSSNPHHSPSTVDNSPTGLGITTPLVPTPSTQISEFEFSVRHPDSSQPPAAEVEMPAVIHKHKKAASDAPPLPAKVPLDQPVIAPAGNVHMMATPALPFMPPGPNHARSRSAQPSPQQNHHARLQPARRSSPPPGPRGRSSSAQPPSKSNSALGGPRNVSGPVDQRSASKHSSDGESRGRLRRSWLPGGRSRSGSKDLKMSESNAWILSPNNQADYNLFFLVNGEKVPELWSENGTVYVYLFPRDSGRGPSFKIPAQAIEASIVFYELIQAEFTNNPSGRGRGNSLTVEDAQFPPEAAEGGSWGDARLYILPAGPGQVGANQTSQPDVKRLVAIRNLFAFLTGQPLVGTKAAPTIFAAFLQISSLLKEFDFCSVDGTSWGDAVDLSFGFYMSQLALADVRRSREKTLEAIILGERMRCWDLYNEAFTHAVGKFAAIMDAKSPLLKQVSDTTRQRLERAHLDLLNRQHNVNMRLEEFEFPALFAGVGSSSEFKDTVRFGRWRASFAKMRSFVLSYYKSLFGNWPPKARSKKNPFSESGLNRLVLKELYVDLCSLYDLLVDRDSLTPRVIDQNPEELSASEADPNILALRKMLSEFDHSSPPVLPPIPFDIPKIPTMASVMATYDELKDKDQAKFLRNIQPHELQLVMHKSYNFDADGLKSRFLNDFRNFDLRDAKGKSPGELADHRIGIWLFLYVVIQSLPLLVIDAPDLRFTEGVEYFLCQPPMGNPPWIEDGGEIRKAWYQISGSQVKVELSADVVMFSVEATYNRSHCWEAAKAWEEAKNSGGLALPPPQAEMAMSPLVAPPPVFEDMDPMNRSPSSSAPGSPMSGPRRRNISPGPGLAAGRASGSPYRSSLSGIGLEPLPPPLGAPLTDRRSSRIYSSGYSDSLGSRPQSAGPGVMLPRVRSSGNVSGMGSRHGSSDNTNNVQDAQGPHHARQGSTFDDILKDMGNQQKPTKKKFGF